LPIRIQGDSAAETHGAVRRVVDFIQRGLADKSEKLYFVYGPSNAVPYVPLWGQQFLYYEIKSIFDVDLTRLYPIAELRSKTFFISLPLMIGPYALGQRQLVGSATGGILEQVYATPDGRSRGLIIPEVTTNLVPNPIFGNSTYSTGWTADANLALSENTKKNFVLFGDSSAKISSSDGASNTFYITITLAASTHAFSVYAKLTNGGTISDSVLTLSYAGTGLTETYTAIGDGWYKITATETGSGGASTFRIILAANYTAYIGGVQIETKAYSTPMCYGDQLDCSWASTVHNSASTRTVARWRLPVANFSIPQGTFEIIWKAPYSSSVIPDNTRIFQTDRTSGFQLYWNSSNYWTLNDGTNSENASGAASAFSTGDILVFHVVYGTAGLDLYKNGVRIINGAAYNPLGDESYFYLGSSATPNQHSNGVYMGLTCYDREMSSTEIAARYGDIEDHLSGGDGYGQALMPIPWLWTDDGDNVLDGCDDSTRENWAMIGGIPGNSPAGVWTNMSKTSFGDAVDILITDIPFDKFQKHSGFSFYDASGTADASDCGGEHLDIGTPTALPRTEVSFTPDYPELFSGKNIYFFVRAKHQTTTGNVSAGRFIDYNRGYIKDSDVTLAVTTTYKLFYLGALRLSIPFDDGVDITITPSINFGSAIAASNLWIDFFEAFPGKMQTIDFVSTDVPGGGAALVYPTQLYLNMSDKTGYTNTTTLSPSVTGEKLNLYPNALNMFVLYIAAGGAAHTLTPAVTITSLEVTPRWSLL